MKYVEVCKALYDYDARTDDELSIKEDNILYVIEKEDDDWWRAELKQANGEEQSGPVGLVPASYLEVVPAIGRVRAEYDYTAQQEEELSFQEGDEMDLLETDDPDWYLVRASNGDIGLAPSNYVHDANEGFEDAQEELPASSPAVAQPPTQSPQPTPPTIAPPQLQPILSHTTGSTTATGNGSREMIADDAQSWNVYEYDPIKKKKKKSKGSLFIGNGMLCYGSETDKASPVQQYPILSVTKYLYDGKNLHIEINGNGKNAVLDLQASSKSEAKAILAKIADSTRAAQMSNTQLSQNTPERQIAAPAPAISPAQPQHYYQQHEQPEDDEEDEPNCEPRWGISLYAFDAEGGDEISVAENEQIYVVDYVRTDGWWRVQKVDGEMGIIPSSYVQFDDEDEEGGERANQAVAGHAATHQQNARSMAPDNVEDIRKKRLEEERALQQRRAAEEEAHEQQKRMELERQRREEEEQRRRKDEERRRREEEEERRQREMKEKEKRRQQQEAARRAEMARHKQLEEDYRRKDAERKASLARSQSSAKHSSSSHSNRHQDLPKPDSSKIRTWTDRSGTFKVEAQFIDYHNGKLRLHKLNGVKIDVPVEKMSAEDIKWVEDHTRQQSSSSSSTAKRGVKEPEMTPPMPPRPQPTGGSSSSTQQKKFNEKWDWFDWFMMIGVPMQTSLRYASAFKAEKLDDSDIENLTHKKMKTLGMSEDHVRRVEKFIETGKVEEPDNDNSKNKQLEQDEELARKLQNEWNSGESPSKNAASRPKPSVSAPKDVHPDLLDLIGSRLSGSSEPINKEKEKEPKQPESKGPAGFADDAWTPRSNSSPLASLAALKPTPAAPSTSTAVPSAPAINSPSPAPAPVMPTGPSPEEIKAAEAKRKRMQEEEQIQKIQLLGLQEKAREQQKQLEELQKLTEQQLQLQKQLAMQTGTQQQRLQQQQQMLDIQAQQQTLQQQLGQQPSQLQPSLTAQPTGFMATQPTGGFSSASMISQPTGSITQPTGGFNTTSNLSLATQVSSPGRLRPSASNNIFSDPTLGQWQPSQPQTTQQPLQTGFQPPQQQSSAWQALQPQMTGFPPTNSNQGTADIFQPQQQQRQTSLPLPPSLSPSSAAGQQNNVFGNAAATPLRAQTMQPTGRHWNTATPDNPFGSPTMAPLQAQMTGVNFSTPSPQAFNQSPLQPQQQNQMQQNYMQPQMTGFAPQQAPPPQQPAGSSIFTPQGSMQYGQSAFPAQRPW